MAKRWAAVLAAAAWIVLSAAGAGAVTFALNVEFDDGTVDTFGAIEVTEAGGDLLFEITLDPTLGPDRDLHQLYFNLESGFTGLAISSTDVVTTAYVLSTSPPVTGGAGSSFDFGVNFGNGGGPPGNGTLQLASFTLSADQALSVADLLIASAAKNDTLEVYFAVHVQGTAYAPGVDSETVGALVPEPGTLTLLLGGLAGLYAATPRRRRPAG